MDFKAYLRPVLHGLKFKLLVERPLADCKQLAKRQTIDSQLRTPNNRCLTSDDRRLMLRALQSFSFASSPSFPPLSPSLSHHATTVSVSVSPLFPSAARRRLCGARARCGGGGGLAREGRQDARSGASGRQVRVRREEGGFPDMRRPPASHRGFHCRRERYLDFDL
ncbi:hypothetical protein Taro_011081 [Colocasia esculenta]|uniref:Uncharacterized protein n=1 Tax=Colocasia esculenta TaxID=4460 RepID=A0A843U5B3_COLES|nr:hypothetical protein [Colocasia esculenta]